MPQRTPAASMPGGFVDRPPPPCDRESPFEGGVQLASLAAMGGCLWRACWANMGFLQFILRFDCAVDSGSGLNGCWCWVATVLDWFVVVSELVVLPAFLGGAGLLSLCRSNTACGPICHDID